MKLTNARSSLAPAAVQYGKPRAGDLGRAFEIENAESLAEIDVILQLKIEIRAARPIS